MSDDKRRGDAGARRPTPTGSRPIVLDPADPTGKLVSGVNGPDITTDPRIRRDRRTVPGSGRWPLVGRVLVVALCGALVLLSLNETLNALTAPLRVASDADWQAAAAEVRTGFRPGDLIVFAPAWADPVGRYWLGDLIPVEMAARADADRYARIWEVSVRNERAPETLAANAFPEGSHRHGGVRVALYRRHGVQPPVYDFTDRLTEARVIQTQGGETWERPCLHDGAGFRCSGTRVERRILEVDYRPYRGVLVPIDGRLVASLAWDEVPAGDVLVGHTGLHDYFARKNSDGPVEFKVLVNGDLALEQVVRNDDGWKRFEIDTARYKGHGPLRVRFEVGAPAAARNFGFHAEMRNAPAPEAD